jgi:hypothetical protein
MKPIDHEAFLRANATLSDEEQAACRKRAALSQDELFKETIRRIAEYGVPVENVQARAKVMFGVLADAYKVEVIAAAAAKRQHPKSAESASVTEPGKK